MSEMNAQQSAELARAYRNTVGEFATGVTVVTAELDGVPAGMTLNSFTSISLHPLLVLVSLAHGSRTLGAVRGSGRFAISILHRGQRDIAVAFAERGAEFPLHLVRRDRLGFISVPDAAATLWCEVREIVTAGDHDLILGEVIDFQHRGGQPLVFHRGTLGGLQPDAHMPASSQIGLEEGAGW